jgi:type IV conjugative transfer system protein TraE
MVLLLGPLLLANVLLLVLLFSREQITVLVPSNGGSQFTLSSRKVSGEYLEAISRDVVQTFFNLTPHNLGYVFHTILPLAHPKFYSTLKYQLENIGTAIATRKFSTSFQITGIDANSAELKAVVDGLLCIHWGRREISRQMRRYQLKYQLSAAGLSIIDFRELPREKNEIFR